MMGLASALSRSSTFASIEAQSALMSACLRSGQAAVLTVSWKHRATLQCSSSLYPPSLTATTTTTAMTTAWQNPQHGRPFLASHKCSAGAQYFVTPAAPSDVLALCGCR